MIINKASRQSKNVIDARPKPLSEKEKLGEHHRRQIFDPKTSKKITTMMNKMANADRLANKGPGASAMKSPAKVTDSRFSAYKKDRLKGKGR